MLWVHSTTHLFYVYRFRQRREILIKIDTKRLVASICSSLHKKTEIAPNLPVPIYHPTPSPEAQSIASLFAVPTRQVCPNFQLPELKFDPFTEIASKQPSAWKLVQRIYATDPSRPRHRHLSTYSSFLDNSSPFPTESPFFLRLLGCANSFPLPLL